jgi:hypothetical protein
MQSRKQNHISVLPTSWNKLFSLHSVKLHWLHQLEWSLMTRHCCFSRDRTKKKSQRVLRFDSRRGLTIFLFITASRTALGPTQPPAQWVAEASSLEVKRPGHESDRSPPSSAEVKEWVELYLHSPNTLSWRGAQLKHRDNFTFIFTFTENYKRNSGMKTVPCTLTWTICRNYSYHHHTTNSFFKESG